MKETVQVWHAGVIFFRGSQRAQVVAALAVALGVLALCAVRPTAASRSAMVPGTAAVCRSDIVPDTASRSAMVPDTATVRRPGMVPGIAAVPDWTQIGDAGGAAVQALALNPASAGVIYAGTCDRGLYVTANSGLSWTNPLTACVAAIAFDPQVTTTVYAGTMYGGAYRSTGAAWAAINNGLTADHVTALATVSGSPARIYAGSETGVYTSTNRGDNWFPASSASSIGSVRALAAGGAMLFAATEQGVFRSSNGGASWAPANEGLAAEDVRSLAAQGATVYAGTERGLFRSADGGTSWKRASLGLPAATVQSVVAAAQAPHVVFAGTEQGVYGSATGGDVWVNLNANLSGWALVANALAVDGGNGSWTLYAGTGNGVWKRTVTEDELTRRIWLPLIASSGG